MGTAPLPVCCLPCTFSRLGLVCTLAPMHAVPQGYVWHLLVNESRMFSASNDKTIRLWDVDTVNVW